MSQFTLNLPNGSLSFDFGKEEAQQLHQALQGLLNHLKTAAAKPAGTAAPKSTQKPTPLPALDYKHRGDLVLEVFCNPNIWPSPFAAKVLVTLKSDRVRLSSETELSQMLEDINQFIEQHS